MYLYLGNLTTYYFYSIIFFSKILLITTLLWESFLIMQINSFAKPFSPPSFFLIQTYLTISLSPHDRFYAIIVTVLVVYCGNFNGNTLIVWPCTVFVDVRGFLCHEVCVQPINLIFKDHSYFVSFVGVVVVFLFVCLINQSYYFEAITHITAGRPKHFAQPGCIHKIPL